MPNQQDRPGDLDALIAAPQVHTLLFENELVRVLDTKLGPGEITPLHTHSLSATLLILSWSDCVRRDGEENILMDSRISGTLSPGMVVWSAPLPPHTLENVGKTQLHVIAVELKTSR